MKVLIVVGSARKGNSQFLANCIAKTVHSKQLEVVRLSDYEINYCTGCLECDETHECYIKDGMEVLLEKVKEAETLVMVSPARYSLLSGDCKVFIDRLNPTAVSEEIVGKKFIGVVVGQSEEDAEDHSIVKALQSLVDFAENAGMEVLGRYAVYNCYDPNSAEGQEGIEELCQEIAARIQP